MIFESSDVKFAIKFFFCVTIARETCFHFFVDSWKCGKDNIPYSLAGLFFGDFCFFMYSSMSLSIVVMTEQCHISFTGKLYLEKKQ